MTAYERRLEIAIWGAREIIPHEKRARSILARSRVAPEHIDELIQEAYTPDHTQVKDGAYRAFGPYIVRGRPDSEDNARVEGLYAGLNDAIRAVRPRGDHVLSICAWGEADVANWAHKYGTMWRTSPDITPDWASMLHNFDSALANQQNAGNGHWNDPDMLEIGNGEFDADHLTEARAHLSLWAMINAA